MIPTNLKIINREIFGVVLTNTSWINCKSESDSNLSFSSVRSQLPSKQDEMDEMDEQSDRDARATRRNMLREAEQEEDDAEEVFYQTRGLLVD